MPGDERREVAHDTEDLRSRLAAHHRDGYAWALSCCGWNAVEAENVLQSTYVKILDGRAAYAGRSTFRTWLFAVIRLTAAQERRRNWLFTRRFVYEPEAIDSAAIEHDPADAIHREQMRAHLQHALRRLPSRQREVIVLVFDNELTLDQAAAVMGVSAGSARRHYDRAKRRLREWMQSTRSIDGEASRSAA